MNRELANKIADIIEFEPEKYDQETFFCGTTACVAGHAALLTGWNLFSETQGEAVCEKEGQEKHTFHIAMNELDIDRKGADELFYAYQDKNVILHFLRKGEWPEGHKFTNRHMNWEEM